jgi:hypothetical protein
LIFFLPSQALLPPPRPEAAKTLGWVLIVESCPIPKPELAPEP